MRGVAVMIGAACVLALACLEADNVRAERQHTVRAGQSFASIARSYRMSVHSLAAANARPTDAGIAAGEVLKVPDRNTIVLAQGQTLWSIAHGHGCSVVALARANGIAPSTRLRPGSKLVLPPSKHKVGPIEPPIPEANVLRGPAARTSPSVHARLYRVATHENLKLALTDARGVVRPGAAVQLARFLRPRHSKKQKRPPPRLVQLLAEVAKHYEGKTIQVISGYRVAGGYTSKESRHTKGAAIDLRVAGVPERRLCDYLRTFHNVGVGLYPNSGFVHFDVRDKNAYWIDLSSPGRRPSYLDGEQREHFLGKNKDEGLVELGRAVSAAVEDGREGEAAELD